MTADVNTLRWKMGWSPWLVILGTTILFAIIGAMVEAIGAFAALGILGGLVAWYWGVREINNKYQPFIKKFIGESERNARRGIEVETADLYNLTYNSGSSPPLVAPAKTYYNTTIVVTDTSINLNKGAEYDMESRSGVGGGSNTELYYDQVTGVQSHQDGAFTELEIQTSGGDSTRISSSATDTVDEVVSEIRQRIRELKNPNSNRGQDDRSRATNRQQSAAAREEPRGSQETESSTAAAQSPDESEKQNERSTSGSEQDSVAAHPITSVADTVRSRTRPTDSLADELCRLLSDPSPEEDRLEELLEDAVDRLEESGAVADAVAGIDDPTVDAQIESAKRSLAAVDGSIADDLDPVFDRVLDQTAETATIEAELAEAEDELVQSEQEYDRIQTEAETVSREASRSDVISFRSNGIAEQMAELADALENERIVFEQPGPDREAETEIGSIAADLERSVRPQSSQSRELLETLGEPASDDVETVLRSTVDSLDAYADLQASVADIGDRDVRRRLDALDDELQRMDGDIYRHLADRVRELEAMLERDGVTDVQLYAIYQESTFYDRTLLPRLSRSVDGESTADTGKLIADIDDRIEAIEREYIDVRADHNHTIPRHFISLAADLRTEAQRIDGDEPLRAVGLCSAANDVLAHVEALYERNEYSVMLRRLRG